MSWYFRVGDSQVGPLTWNELLAAARSDQFGPTDLLWNLETQTWRPATDFPAVLAAYKSGRRSTQAARTGMPTIRCGQCGAPGEIHASSGGSSCRHCGAALPLPRELLLLQLRRECEDLRGELSRAQAALAAGRERQSELERRDGGDFSTRLGTNVLFLSITGFLMWRYRSWFPLGNSEEENAAFVGFMIAVMVGATFLLRHQAIIRSREEAKVRAGERAGLALAISKSAEEVAELEARLDGAIRALENFEAMHVGGAT